MTLAINEHVLWFNISVHDAIFMQVLNRNKDLSQVHADIIFRELGLAVCNFLLLNLRPDVSARTKVCDQVQVVKSLERIMEFDDESVIDFALYFFLSDYEPSQPIISAFFHTLHRKKVVCVYFLDQKYLRISAPAETRDALEVFGRNVDILLGGLFVLFLILLDVEKHVCRLLYIINHLDVSVISRVVKRRLLVLVDAFLRLVASVY